MSTYRQHNALIKVGVESKMIVLIKSSKDPNVEEIKVNPATENFEKKTYFNQVQDKYINQNRTDISNTYFSLDYPGYDLSKNKLVLESDIINLHWMAAFQSPVTLKKIFDLGKPVVWTLHDQRPFTGGCHFTAGCTKYKTNCWNCPQLKVDKLHLPKANLKEKIKLFRDADLTIVSQSKLLAKMSSESAVFKNLSVHVIPNSIETNYYYPDNKITAKKKLGLNEDEIVILFGAHNILEKRKGFSYLMDALKLCIQNPKLSEAIANKKIKLMFFGEDNAVINEIGLPTVSLGYIDSKDRLREIYSAADMFILPTLEDNFPNTMLESMACGTTVIAFKTGGINDVITHKSNGMLVGVADTKGLAEAMAETILNKSLRDKIAKAAAEEIKVNYTLEIQGNRYKKIFEEVIERAKQKKKIIINKNYVAEELVDFVTVTGEFTEKALEDETFE